MRFHSLSLGAALLILASCQQFKVAGQVGYAQLALDGEIGFAAGSTTTDIGQDVTTAFGLGDDQGLPYGRFNFDMGVPTLTVSAFVLEEEGTGTLAKNFGGNPLLSAGANVNTDFELSNAKASLVFDISLGPVTISPGLAADYFDFNFQVTQVNGLASEVVELEAPVPIGILRAAADIGIFSGMAEVGYMEADIDELEAKLLDIDAMLTVHATEVLDLWVGYRYLAIDGDGLIDNDTFLSDIKIDGIVFGGGVRF